MNMGLIIVKEYQHREYKNRDQQIRIYMLWDVFGEGRTRGLPKGIIISMRSDINLGGWKHDQCMEIIASEIKVN